MLIHFDKVIENKMFVEDIHINDLNILVDKDIDHQHQIMEHMYLFFTNILFDLFRKRNKPLFLQGFSWQNGIRFSQNSPTKPGSHKQIPAGAWTKIHVPLFWHGEWLQNVVFRKSCSQNAPVNNGKQAHLYPSFDTKKSNDESIFCLKMKLSYCYNKFHHLNKNNHQDSLDSIFQHVLLDKDT